jgi:hypothetical protein
MSQEFARQWLGQVGVEVGEKETHESLRAKLVTAAMEKIASLRGSGLVGGGFPGDGLTLDPLNPPWEPRPWDPRPWPPRPWEPPVWPPRTDDGWPLYPPVPTPSIPVAIREVNGGGVCKLGFTGGTFLVQAWGKVKTSGWTSPQLLPVAGFPDADGTMTFAFVAVPPTGIVLQILTPIFAAALWSPPDPAALRKIVLRAASNSFEIPIDWNALPSCVFQPFDLGTVLE